VCVCVCVCAYGKVGSGLLQTSLLTSSCMPFNSEYWFLPEHFSLLCKRGSTQCLRCLNSSRSIKFILAASRLSKSMHFLFLPVPPVLPTSLFNVRCDAQKLAQQGHSKCYTIPPGKPAAYFLHATSCQTTVHLHIKQS
jgi:hypothetical protein